MAGDPVTFVISYQRTPAWFPPVVDTLTVWLTTSRSTPPMTRSAARYMSRSDTASSPAEVPGCLMQSRDSLARAHESVGTGSSAGPVSVPPLTPPLLEKPTLDTCQTCSAEPDGATLVSAATNASTQFDPSVPGEAQAAGNVVPS